MAYSFRNLHLLFIWTAKGIQIADELRIANNLQRG